MTKISISTLGCKVNQYDSASIGESLQKRGFEIVSSDAVADVVIVNTCVVTSKTEAQSRQVIRRALKRSPLAHVVVTGCYAQKSQEDLIALSDRVHVFGNREKNEIPLFVSRLLEFGSVENLVSDISLERKFTTAPFSKFFNKTRAFLKIQDGCNSRCTYCIVPQVRGPSRSLMICDVKSRIHQFVQAGYHEIVLTGIHLGAFGLDLQPQGNIENLLKAIESEELLLDCRIRLSSVEPTEFSDDLISFLSQSHVVCPHLHIPLQSGDENILRRMGRSYSPSFFQNLVERLTTNIEDLNIGIDVIAGFPGETDEQFQTTVKFIQSLQIGYAHVFPYSCRQGTVAAQFKEQVSEPEKKERVKILRNVSLQKKNKFYDSFRNRTLSVLVETCRDKTTGWDKGFSRNYIPISFDGHYNLTGKEVKVKIKEVREDKVYGVVEK